MDYRMVSLQVVNRSYRVPLARDEFSILTKVFPDGTVDYLPNSMKDLGASDAYFADSILGPAHGGFLYMTISAQLDTNELHERIKTTIIENIKLRRLEADRL